MNTTKLTLFLMAAGAVSAFAQDKDPWYYQANENNWSKSSDEKRTAPAQKKSATQQQRSTTTATKPAAAQQQRKTTATKPAPAAKPVAAPQQQKAAVPASAVSQKEDKKATFSVELVYGLATDDLYKEDGDKIDGIDTVGIRATLEGTPIISTKEDFFTLTPFVSVDFACGDDSTTYFSETDSTDWATYTVSESMDSDLVRFAAVIGLRARLNLSRYIALTAHVKAGVDCVYMSSTWAYSWDVAETSGDRYSYYEDCSSDSSFAGGFCYGAGIGVEVNVSENWGLIANVEYFGSTAQPRLAFTNDYDPDCSWKFKPDDQAYVMFSVGAAYRF